MASIDAVIWQTAIEHPLHAKYDRTQTIGTKKIGPCPTSPFLRGTELS